MKEITIVITEKFESEEELISALNRIAGLIGEGYSSGYYPSWYTEEKESE